MAKIAVEKSTGLVWEAWGDGYQLEFGRHGLEVSPFLSLLRRWGLGPAAR